MKSPLGKNQLGKFLLEAVSAVGLHSGKKKFSNPSVRKTSIGRLLDANFPENYVMQLSGHKNVYSLSTYKLASVSHQCQMSDTLRGRKEPAASSSSHAQSRDSVSSVQNIQNNVTFVSYSAISSSSNALEAVFSGASISSPGGGLPYKSDGGARRIF